jgi:DNA-binding LacI/PurR family transcriptional regulator
MVSLLRIGLVFDYNLGYPRRVLCGVRQYAQTKPHWLLVPLDAAGLTRRVLHAVRPDGLMALVVTATQADALGSLRRPLVNVAAVLPGLPFPLVTVDHRQIGELAARHLRDRGFRQFG